ncbi:hypothetical protein [Actinomadura roseirufa]|uniref:hypothetical protein n=1 Tax=Actinomadura roseirufa TaxID=2094049 RepID=UPI0010418373|nr:hypothetical protein [Actinomadura roseirufa]
MPARHPYPRTRHATAFRNVTRPALGKQGADILRWDELAKTEQERLRRPEPQVEWTRWLPASVPTPSGHGRE